MHFDFDAGKYAVYVWPAFALTAAVFGWMIADSLLAARRWRAEAERRQAEAKEPRK
ncbi:heme exporter protein CcmD [Caulobacter radicis]|uniref:heme exporter protein CcmD n=1 Tax=Caulobacter radicis TaxID=2172650 RepID=UPI000D57D7D7|nr:heme exporter protein CcmD [Caulobacter radicis]PVM85051.1 heme exporter protein CcmD [Caulobacter radicis]